MLTIFDEQSREVEVYDVKPSKAEKVKKPFRLGFVPIGQLRFAQSRALKSCSLLISCKG